MTLIGALAALFLKKASVFKSVKRLFLNYNFYFGGFLYFITALINIYVLKYLDYSVVLPFTALTYFWTMIISRIFLKEVLSMRKVIGLVSIIIGVWVITL